MGVNPYWSGLLEQSQFPGTSYAFPGTREQDPLCCLTLLPATLEGASGLGRRVKGKVSGSEDQEGKGEGREEHGSGEGVEREER